MTIGHRSSSSRSIVLRIIVRGAAQGPTNRVVAGQNIPVGARDVVVAGGVKRMTLTGIIEGSATMRMPKTISYGGRRRDGSYARSLRSFCSQRQDRSHYFT